MSYTSSLARFSVESSTLTVHDTLETNGLLYATNSTITAKNFEFSGGTSLENSDIYAQDDSGKNNGYIKLKNGDFFSIRSGTLAAKKFSSKNCSFSFSDSTVTLDENIYLIGYKDFDTYNSTVSAKSIDLKNQARLFIHGGTINADDITITVTPDQIWYTQNYNQFTTLMTLDGATLNINSCNVKDINSEYGLTGIELKGSNLKINGLDKSTTPIVRVENIRSRSGGELKAIHIGQQIATTNSFDILVNNVTNSMEDVQAIGISAASVRPSTILGKVKISNINGGYIDKNTYDEHGRHLSHGEFGTATGVIGGNLTFGGGIIIDNLRGINKDKEECAQFAVIGKNLGNKYKKQQPIRIGTNGLVYNNNITNFDLIPTGVNIISGDMYAYDTGIEAAFANSGYVDNTSQLAFSSFTGRTLREKDIPLELLFKNKGTWNVTADSELSALRLHENGVVDLTVINGTSNPKVRTQWLQGVNADSKGFGTIKMHFDIKDQNNSSQIITNVATGKINVELSLDNYDSTFKKSNVPLIIENPELEDGTILEIDGSKLTTQLTYKDGAVVAPELKFFETNDDTDNGKNQSTGNGAWYLVVETTNPDSPNSDSSNNGVPPSVTPDTDSDSQIPVTPEVDQILSLANSNAFGFGLLNEIEDLRTRLGDVRYGNSDGMWARTYAQKDRFSDNKHAFKQESFGLHFGLDHLLNPHLLCGLAFHYGSTDQDSLLNEYKGKGDLDQYTLKAYGTYFTPKGTYVDIVGTVGRLETELTGITNSKEGRFKAKYKNIGYGISSEIGHRLELGQWISGKWYVEPSAQLSWFHINGTDFDTSSGMNVSQSDVDYLTGRIGAAVGATIPLGNEGDPLEQYLHIGMQAGMLYQFDSDQRISANGTDGAKIKTETMSLDGIRAYYGLSMDWQANDAIRYYGKISRQEGSGYTREYDISVGVRYSF